MGRNFLYHCDGCEGAYPDAGPAVIRPARVTKS